MKWLKTLLIFISENELVLAFGVIYAVLFFLLPPQLMFQNVWAGGGDLGSHQLPAYIMQKEFFPGFFGWTNRWYFGMPLFTFYFPLPFYFMAWLATFTIPLAIAFKIGVMIGVYALPTSVYFFSKKIGLKAPALAAIFSIFPLILKSNIISGGSINSTFAGEFTHLWAMNFMLLGLGFVYQKTKPVLAGLFFALATLSHSLATVFLAAALPLWLLIAERKKTTVFYYLKVLFFAFIFTSFWLIPFLLYRNFSSDLGYPSGKELTNYLYEDKLLWLAFVLALFSDWRAKNIRFLTLLAATGILLWLFLPSMGIWLPRFLSFYYLFLFILASQSFLLTGVLKEKELQLGLAVVLLIFGIKINDNNATISANYRFAMAPPALSGPLNNMISDLNRLPADSRVINEYSDAVTDFWSPRGTELLPIFAPQNYTNGLYLESSVMTSAAYFLQAEISVHKEQVGNYFQSLPPLADIKQENAYDDLRFLGVNYLIINENNEFFKTHPEQYRLIRSYDKDHNLYQVLNTEPLITAVSQKPIILNQKMTRLEREKLMGQWLLDGYKTPLVLSDKQIGDWKVVKSYEEYKSSASSQITPITQIPLTPTAQLGTKKITLDNLVPGESYYLRVSYFPAWKSKTAEVYFSAPGLMLIVPKEKRVELDYKPLGW